MIGCMLLGAAGVFLAARIFHHRHHAFYGGGCHGGGWGRHHHHGRPFEAGEAWDDDRVDFGPGGGRGWGFGRRFGRGFVLRAVAERLRASPAQERVIRDAVDELHDTASKLRGEAEKTRADVAGAFRKPNFDEVFFGELFARHDRAIEDLRKAFMGAGAKIHDTLDEDQRARLADMIEQGPRGWRSAWRRRGSGMGPGSW